MKFNGHYFNFCTFTTDAPISVKANEFMDFVDLNSYKALQAKNERLQEALKYIAFVGPDQCEDIRFGIENNCLAEVYKAEAERTLWEKK